MAEEKQTRRGGQAKASSSGSGRKRSSASGDGRKRPSSSAEGRKRSSARRNGRPNAAKVAEPPGAQSSVRWAVTPRRCPGSSATTTTAGS